MFKFFAFNSINLKNKNPRRTFNELPFSLHTLLVYCSLTFQEIHFLENNSWHIDFLELFCHRIRLPGNQQASCTALLSVLINCHSSGGSSIMLHPLKPQMVIFTTRFFSTNWQRFNLNLQDFQTFFPWFLKTNNFNLVFFVVVFFCSDSLLVIVWF